MPEHKPLGIWVTPSERDCHNCGFLIMYGEDTTCIYKQGVVKAGLDVPITYDDWPCEASARATTPAIFCSTWHPHCRAITAHRKAWYRGPERQRMNDEFLESIVGPLDRLHFR